MSDRSTLAPRDRRAFALPVHSWWRRTPAGNWLLLGHGPLDALLALSRDGDLIVPAGELPPDAPPGLKTTAF